MGHLLLAIAVLLGFFIAVATVWVPHWAALIQNQLHDRARTRLIDAGQDYVAVSVDGRDLTLSGLAPDQASRDRAIALVRDIGGVRHVLEHIELSERYLLQASYSGSQLCLRGVVPSVALRDEWTRLSPMPCMRDLDAALGVDEAPSGWIWPGLLLAELVRLESATLDASEQRVSIHGVARSAEQRAVIESTLRGVVPTTVSIELDITVAQPTPRAQPPAGEESGQ